MRPRWGRLCLHGYFWGYSCSTPMESVVCSKSYVFRLSCSTPMDSKMIPSGSNSSSYNNVVAETTPSGSHVHLGDNRFISVLKSIQTNIHPCKRYRIVLEIQCIHLERCYFDGVVFGYQCNE